MKVVIVGDGKVGYTLTKSLSEEGHDLVVIDNNKRILLASQESLDVAVVDGNGASVEVQREAGVDTADLLIAAAHGDETNLLCCMVAKKLGCKHTIARVRNPEYDQQIRFMRDELGLSMVINPEKAAALEIFRLLQFPSFLKRDSFARGNAELVELKLTGGKPLQQFRTVADVNALVCAVERDNEIHIPKGDFTLHLGDKVTIAADAADLVKLIKNLKVYSPKAQRVMIIGGSRTAAYLAQRLIRNKIDLTIVEQDEKRCMDLSEALPQATVINGNGTDQKLLLSEGIASADAVVSLMGIDEENLLVSMFASYVGVPKSITKISRNEYNPIFESMGIDSIVSPKLLTANEIVRYVRAMEDTTGGSVLTLYKIVDGKAEALEFSVKGEAKFLNLPLYRLKLKKNVLIAAIIRARRVIIPSGADVMQKGDTVIVVTEADRAIRDLKDIFEGEV